MAVVEEEFGLEDEPLDIASADRARLHTAIRGLAANAATGKVGLRGRDFMAAVVVFFLVALSAVPGIVPFLLIDDEHLALRVSNTVLLLLLFLAGYGWAHYTDSRPMVVGLVVAVLGLAMVLLAIPLGG